MSALKVVFFLLDGDTNASSRQRVLQYFPLLREHGIEPVASRPVPETVYQHLVEGARGTTGAKAAGAKAAYYGMFVAQRAADVMRAGRFEVAVIQRDLFPFGPPWLERLLAARHARLVYDTDDATYLRPGFTPNTPFQRLRRFDKVVEVVTRARWVSAATEPIAEWARRYNSHVSVVPMAVDLTEYDRCAQCRRNGAQGRPDRGRLGRHGWRAALSGHHRTCPAPVGEPPRAGRARHLGRLSRRVLAGSERRCAAVGTGHWPVGDG